jgi:hypothetical protein
MADKPGLQLPLIIILLSALLFGGGLWLFLGVKDEPAPVTPAATPEQLETPAATPTPVMFTDITTEAGIEFMHVNGAYGDRLLPETMGSGAAFFDADNDGDQDLLFVNSDHWPGRSPAAAETPTLALYANDGTGQFTDITEEAGLAVSGYGMGVAIGDIDNDGWQDLFITYVGSNRLFRNSGGSFSEVAAAAGAAGSEDAWSTGALFFDMENDGDLDLFVLNYIRWTQAIDLSVNFQLTGIGRAYGPPTAFEGTFAWLYENDGSGNFTDISEPSGIRVKNPSTGSPMGKGLAVTALDIDSDGLLDLAVANDTVQNFLFRNLGGGQFEEIGTGMGIAYDRNGHATGAMGIDTAHYRNDATLGVVIGNFANEMSSLYVMPQPDIPFSDDAIIEGIGPASRKVLSFATLFFDYDLDGRLDLLEINGHIENAINRVQSSQQYAQPPQLFWNCGDACDTAYLVTQQTEGNDLFEPIVGRGAAYADIDGDGDLDLALTQAGREARLLRNDTQPGNNWLRIRLQGKNVNRDAIGAAVTVTAGETTQKRLLAPVRGYLSQVEMPLTFGLGQATEADVAIRWPDGSTEDVEQVPANQQITIVQGEGKSL